MGGKGVVYINPGLIEKLKTLDQKSVTNAVRILIKRFNKVVELLEDGYLVEENMKDRDFEWLTSKVNKL